ncbi:MAG: hypothetical protein LC708_00945, partial [Actinobacteria bacterium]|nr:hypothetical protein [Actinomycetota bacterium]
DDELVAAVDRITRRHVELELAIRPEPRSREDLVDRILDHMLATAEPLVLIGAPSAATADAMLDLVDRRRLERRLEGTLNRGRRRLKAAGGELAIVTAAGVESLEGAVATYAVVLQPDEHKDERLTAALVDSAAKRLAPVLFARHA